MTAYKGSLVLLKVGNGMATEVFTTIGGLRTSHLALNNRALDASNVESGSWRLLLGAAGISSLTLSGNGMFTNSAAEELVRSYAFANSVNNYQFIFANGDMVSAPFQIIDYARAGMVESEEVFSVTLESAGMVTFTHA